MEPTQNGAGLRLGSTSRKLDAAAISQGILKEHAQHPGFKVMILPAASFNPRFREAVQNEAMAGVAEGKDAKEAESSFIRRYDNPEFVVDALVADMQGIYDGDGDPVPYTREIGVQVLSDLGFADVKEWIVNTAHEYGQFYAKAVEEEAKN